MLAKTKKTDIVHNFELHQGDTGSPDVQIALLTEKVNELTAHLKSHRKDHSSRRGLLKMVAKRRKLLSYLEKTNEKTYKKIIKELGLKG